MGKGNINSTGRGRRKPSKKSKTHNSTSTKTATATPSRLNKSRVTGSGTTRAIAGSSVVATVRAISKKKAKKLERDEEYKRKRRIEEALEKGEVEMGDFADSKPVTKKEIRKAKIAEEGRKLAEEKEEAANAMEMDA